MSRCRDVDALLALDMPLSVEPMPAALTLHIEACPRCAAAFDLRFPPLRLDARPAPPALRQRWLRQGPSWAPAVLLAAAMLIGVLMPEPPEATPAQAGLLPVSLLSLDDMVDTCETEPDHLPECVIEPS